MLFFKPKNQDELLNERAREPRAAEPEADNSKHWPPEPKEWTSSGPYTTGEEHLWDELRRIDNFVRAQTIRWRLTIGAAKPQQLWGMIHVTDAEVDAYLESEFLPPNSIPAELHVALSDYWDAASRMRAAIQERLRVTPAGDTLPFERLKSVCGLADHECDVIALCLLPELEGRYRRLFGYLQDDVSRTSPTVELILQMLHPVIDDLEVGRSSFASESLLLKQHLLSVNSDDSLPMRPVRLDSHIVNFLLGSKGLDERLSQAATLAEPIQWDELIVETESLEEFQSFSRWWQDRRASATGATLFLHGPYGAGRLRAAQAICTAVGTELIVVDVAGALRSPNGFEQTVDLAYREAPLRGSAVYWAQCEILLDQNQPPHQWQYLVNRSQSFKGLGFLSSTLSWEPGAQFRERPYQRLEFPLPGYALRRRLWKKHLPVDALFDPSIDRDELAEQLANGFQLTEGRMLDVLDTARELAFRRNPQQISIRVTDIYEACRRQSSRQLITFARRIEPRTDLKFQDLVMPEPNRVQLMELRSRIHHRSRVYSGFGFERRLSLGKGLIALFTGSSGTGKTMAAELLAREQGVDLYKVDLSAVVSKYVGETEKNLSRVFAEAEDANAIIFFDEADALFGKRGEVKEAQDRWANMEVNFLLQRVEEYAGVVILASNLRQNIDEAFMRRIHIVVEFPFPEASSRFNILTGLFPGEIDRPEDPELRLLTDRFKLAGGSLKNIVLDAAFRAMSENGHHRPRLTLRHLVAGAAREYQKLGKPLTRGEFGDDFYHWVEEDILGNRQ